MPIISTGNPLISGMAGADATGMHQQRQQDQVLKMRLQQAAFELEQDKKNAALQDEQRKAREQALPLLLPGAQAQPQQPNMIGPPSPMTAAAKVERDQLEQKHIQVANQIGPLLGKLDDQTLNRVLTELHEQVLRDQDSAARKHSGEWIDRLAMSMGGEKGVPPEVQQIADGFKQMLADPKTDPSDVIKQAMQLAAPRFAQQQDDQLGAMLASKAEATFTEGGKFPSDYAHGVFIQLQGGLADNKTVRENFDKIFVQGLEPVDTGTGKEIWVDAKQADDVRKQVAESFAMKNELDQMRAQLAEMRALYEQARPKLEADKNAAVAQDKAENRGLKLRALNIRETQGEANLKLRAEGQESAAQSRGETLNLGKENAERSLNTDATNAAQKDPRWLKAETDEERQKLVDEYKAKMAPKETKAADWRKEAPGMLTPPNIDFEKLPIVQNADGSQSTVKSISVGFGDKTYLIPTVIDGKVVSEEEAIQSFKKTGKHLGVFKDEASASAYAEAHHAEMGPSKNPVERARRFLSKPK